MKNHATVFGREPAVWVGFIEAALAVLVTFTHWLSPEQSGLLVAVVSAALGVYVAWGTSETSLAAILALAKAGAALAVGFGLNLSDAQTGTLIAVITMGFSLFTRTQTTPLDRGSFDLAE